MKYEIEKRVFLVKNYYQLKSITLVQRAFRREFPKSETPASGTVKNVVSNFEKYGSVEHVAPKPKN